MSDIFGKIFGKDKDKSSASSVTLTKTEVKVAGSSAGNHQQQQTSSTGHHVTSGNSKSNEFCKLLIVKHHLVHIFVKRYKNFSHAT